MSTTTSGSYPIRQNAKPMHAQPVYLGHDFINRKGSGRGQEEVNFHPIKDKTIWKIGGGTALLARWTSDWDCGEETNWYYVIKDDPFDINSLKAKRRYEIKKGNRYFFVRKIDPDNYVDELLDVQIKAFSSYPESYRPTDLNRENLEKSIKQWKKDSWDVFGTFSKANESLCGYSVLNPRKTEIEFQIEKTDPTTERDGINAATVNGIEEFIGDVSNTVGKREVPLTDKELKNYMQKRCPFNHMTVMYKKSAVLKAGNYKHWPSNEDYYLWIRMGLCCCKFANLPEVLVHVRVGKEMYERRGGLKYFQSEEQIQRLMLDKGMISVPRYMVNVGERLVLQVLMPNKIRGWVFQKFAREK